LLQFGHGSEAVETSDLIGVLFREPSFNSATAVKPWKHEHVL